MGKLYKRGRTWWADYFDRNGKRVRESTRTGDQQVARARLRELELATTDRGTDSQETIDHALIYFVDVACAAKPEATVASYQQKARHISRLIGPWLLDNVDRETVERYIATRLGEVAARHSVHKELVVLRGAIDSANQRKRTKTPASVVPRFRSGYVPRTTYLTPDQFLSLVDNLVPPPPARAKPGTLKRREARKQSRALYCLLVALASPRHGEVMALRWEHVDLARGVLRVPKGKTVSRVVAIHPVLRPWLEGMRRDTGPVCEPWSNLRRDIPAACKRAGIPRCTPNDLRRTFASWLVQSGISTLVVSRLLGHSSTRMVDLVYGQLDEATLAAAIQRLPGGCDAGVTSAVPRSDTGRHDLPTSGSAIVDGNSVPRVGIEPTTRGFSVLGDMAPKRATSRQILKLVG